MALWQDNIQCPKLTYMVVALTMWYHLSHYTCFCHPWMSAGQGPLNKYHTHNYKMKERNTAGSPILYKYVGMPMTFNNRKQGFINVLMWKVDWKWKVCFEDKSSPASGLEVTLTWLTISLHYALDYPICAERFSSLHCCCVISACMKDNFLMWWLQWAHAIFISELMSMSFECTQHLF